MKYLYVDTGAYHVKNPYEEMKPKEHNSYKKCETGPFNIKQFQAAN